MLYLLTLGWPWFAAAVALGLMVGVATKARPEGLAVNKGFALGGAACLILLAAAILAGTFQERAALTLEVALLAGSAYYLGVLGGGAIKSSTRSPKPSEKPRSRQTTAPPIQLHGAGAGRRPEAIETPKARSAPPSAAGRASPAPAPSGEKSFPGKRPQALSRPRENGPDDLEKIKGVGPKSAEKLNALGIYHFDQIADWSLDNARWIGAALAIPGRIERGKWIQQARELAAHQRQSPNP